MWGNGGLALGLALVRLSGLAGLPSALIFAMTVLLSPTGRRARQVVRISIPVLAGPASSGFYAVFGLVFVLGDAQLAPGMDRGSAENRQTGCADREKEDCSYGHDAILIVRSHP